MEKLPPLPGPGIDVAVDVDGDGVDSFGDRYFFNWWLEQGGDLDLAFSSATANGKLIDLSKFFASSKAQLQPLSPLSGGAGAAPQAGCVPPGDMPRQPTSLPATPMPSRTSSRP